MFKNWRKLKFMLLMCCMLIYTISYSQDKREVVLSLDEVFELADSCNKSIKVKEQGVKIADNAISVSKNALLPDIQFSALATYNGNAWIADRNFSNGNFYSSPHFGNSFSLEISQVVYAGGAIKNRIEESKKKAEMERLNLKIEKQKVRFMLTGYYLDLYKSRNLLVVYNRNIEQTERVIKDMKAKETAGVVLSNDVTRYEVQLENLKYKRTELSSLVSIYNTRLVNILDLPVNTCILPDTTLLQCSTYKYSESQLQEIAKVNSPDLEKSRLNIDINRHDLKILKSGLLPQISVIAGDNLKGPITYEIPSLNNNINTWYVGIGLKYNIGNLYKSSKEIARVNHTILKSKQEYVAAQEDLEMEVQSAYTNYTKAFELLEYQKKSLQLAVENYDVIKNRYINDLALIIDLLDADNIKLSAEIQYVNALINVVYNYYKLLYVIGTL